MAINSIKGASDPLNKSLIEEKGAIAAGTGTTVEKLPVGTNGQVLTANSATTTGLSWTTPGAGLIPQTIVDAKGDLIAGTANDTVQRLAVGTNGQVLTANSAATTGLSWTTPVSDVAAVVYSGDAGTKTATVNIPAGTYLAELSKNTSVTVGGQTITQTSTMTFSNTQTSVIIAGISNVTSASVPVTWTTVNATFASSQVNTIKFQNNLWVAGGNFGRIGTSLDGISWTSRTSNFGNTRVYVIAYGNGIWIAAGDEAQMRRSTDAITWTTVNSNFATTAPIYGIAYGNGIWVATGAGANVTGGSGIRRSTDALTWTTGTVPSPATSNSFFRSTAYGNGFWVATTTQPPYLIQSTDGTTWTTIANTNFAGGTAGGSPQVIDFGGGLWVAAGYGARVSTDRATWTTVSINLPSSVVGRVESIRYANGVWLIGAEYGSLRTSLDGLSWTTQTSNFPTTGPSQTVRASDYGKGVWVIGGGYGTPQMRSSAVSVADPNVYTAIFQRNPSTAT